MVRRLPWRSGSGREALLEVRELSVAHPKFRDWSGGPLGGLGVVRRPSRRSRSGREALL